MTAERLRVLYVAAEAHPWIKTGGLADVAGALPAALRALGHDVRVLLPGYGAAMTRAEELEVDAPAAVAGPDNAGSALLATRTVDGVPVWFDDRPAFRARMDNPYSAADGQPHPDNAEAFAAFARTAARIAGDDLGLGWQADIVHINDWHTGLVPAWLMLARVPAASVFTIHNLAFQGAFPAHMMEPLGLPAWLNHWQALAHHDEFSFMKGALVFADRITTVSATYAEEILQPARGEGLDGVLRHRQEHLHGIVNGIDTRAWDPARDRHIAHNYDASDARDKSANRDALTAELGLDAGRNTPILAWVGRLATQKGADLLLAALAKLLALPACVVILGSGDARIERSLRTAARKHPGRLHVRTGFDEAFAHRLYAGADMLLMPSRFEPCGLAQLNAMRYGTIPIVHATGGLAETVVDAGRTTLAKNTATGFQFHEPTAAALVARCRDAVAMFRDDTQWQSLVRAAMARDSSWARSAEMHVDVYRQALADRLRVLR